MLGRKDAVANIAVKDLEVGKKFYKETLGLTKVAAEATNWSFSAAATGTQRLPIPVRWNQPGDGGYMGCGRGLEGVVQALKAKGVAFEHYDMPDVTGRATSTSRATWVAWFKDPDGNILNVINRWTVIRRDGALILANLWALKPELTPSRGGGRRGGWLGLFTSGVKKRYTLGTSRL